MYPIQSIVVGAGGQPSVLFSNIPQTFTHLQIRAFGRTGGAAGTNMPIQFNGDTTGSNYNTHFMGGNGTNSGSPFSGTFTGSGDIGWVAGGTELANTFGVGIADIFDYTNTSKTKTLRAINGIDSSTAGLVGMWSSVWISTAAITSILIYTSTTGFLQSSRFDLYGISTSSAMGV
jgi:hypothetical protein